MEDADAHADRARRNQRLALGLLMVSIAVLGMMIAVVIGARSGLPAWLLEHVHQAN
jgi:hypothetical protein